MPIAGSMHAAGWSAHVPQSSWPQVLHARLQSSTLKGRSKNSRGTQQVSPPIPRQLRGGQSRCHWPPLDLWTALQYLGEGARDIKRAGGGPPNKTRHQRQIRPARRRVDSTKDAQNAHLRRPPAAAGDCCSCESTGLRCALIECRGFNSIQSKDSGRWHAGSQPRNQSINPLLHGQTNGSDDDGRHGTPSCWACGASLEQKQLDSKRGNK